MKIENNTFEVIIIGGSYAGLSAAMALGRSLRKVLIIDSGEPCNRFTPHSHNFITHDGEAPNEIARKAKEQVLKYKSVQFLEDLAVSGEKCDGKFLVKTSSGGSFTAKKLVIATGVKDVLPDISGFKELWGKTIIHCPYCHGYEFRGQKTAIFAKGDRAMHIASLVNNLTDDLSIITSGRTDFNSDQKDKLARNKIRIIEKEIDCVIHENGVKLGFKGGSTEDFAVVYAAIPFVQHSEIPVFLGCELTEIGHIKVDFTQKTTVSGVYACGDSSSMMRSVAYAVSTGNITGAMINNELAQERF